MSGRARRSALLNVRIAVTAYLCYIHYVILVDSV